MQYIIYGIAFGVAFAIVWTFVRRRAERNK